jgi:uncharacterized pyridoxamine 5'-phosphate oxidase family protein
MEVPRFNMEKQLSVRKMITADHLDTMTKWMLDHYGTALTRMYSLDDGKFEVVYLNHAKATICSFTEAPTVIEF